MHSWLLLYWCCRAMASWLYMRLPPLASAIETVETVLLAPSLAPNLQTSCITAARVPGQPTNEKFWVVLTVHGHVQSPMPAV